MNFLQRLKALFTSAPTAAAPSKTLPYSARFLAFMPFIFEWEGGLDDDKDDPGGVTNFGIDARSHPGVDIRHLTKDGAKVIYWNEWVKDGCEAKPYPLGEVIFNCDVNCGGGRTQSILAEIGSPPSAKAFLDTQEKFYEHLAVAKPAEHKFLQGWLNRVRDLEKTTGLI